MSARSFALHSVRPQFPLYCIMYMVCISVSRFMQTAKMKAEARLELIREAGIDVDEWLTSANLDTLSPLENEDEVSRTSVSEVSHRTSSSGGVSSTSFARQFWQNSR